MQQEELKLKLVEDLKSDVSDVLRRYKVPMDDASLVIDRLDQSVNGLVGAFVEGLREQKKDLDRKQEEIKRFTIDAIRKMRKRSVNVARKAFKEGLAQGEQGANSPSTLQVILTIGLLALAAFVVVDHLFLRRSS